MKRTWLSGAVGTTDGSNEAGTRSVRTFISYRREDAASEARLLYDRLAAHFGADEVFLDVVDIQPGMQWLQEIKSRGAASGVLIAVIGPAWMSSLTGRLKAGLIETTADIVKQEIEFALSRGSGVVVVPVLVSDAAMPAADQLPKSLSRLPAMQAVQLHHASFDHDVDQLIAQLEQLEPGTPEPDSAPLDPPEQAIATSLSAVAAPVAAAPAPDERHYRTVIRHMVDEGTVVLVLGSRSYGAFPDADQLAAKIATELGMELDGVDLARVAQQVYVSSGPSDLHRTLKRILTVEPEPEPGPVHRFLAGLPHVLEQRGIEPRHQMIVTTNYDGALERAFEDANEPYDLAVYMASGPDEGRFVHFPYDRYPEPVVVPNSYTGFPIDDLGELARTIIVKVHGAVDGSSEGYDWKNNYVVTEDQYINYLSRSPVESLVPFQLLNKLRESHCLFLGYALHDWSLRVFLKRIWSDEQLGSRSWAVEQGADFFELDFWRQSNVDLFAAAPDDYVAELQRRILAQLRAGV